MLATGKLESYKWDTLARLSSIIPASDQMTAYFDEVVGEDVTMNDLHNVPEVLYKFDQAISQCLHDFGEHATHEATLWGQSARELVTTAGGSVRGK